MAHAPNPQLLPTWGLFPQGYGSDPWVQFPSEAGRPGRLGDPTSQVLWVRGMAGASWLRMGREGAGCRVDQPLLGSLGCRSCLPTHLLSVWQ